MISVIYIVIVILKNQFTHHFNVLVECSISKEGQHSFNEFVSRKMNSALKLYQEFKVRVFHIIQFQCAIKLAIIDTLQKK